jgi:alkylation response protein AidB-like acyl-CoA dehydrogenase
MITLDGVDLNPSMVWVERYHSDAVAQTTRRTLGGVLVLDAAALEKGQKITLVSEFGGLLLGALRRSVVEEVLARAEVPGATYELVFNGVAYSVAFRHDEPPAVQMEPIAPRTADGENDYFRGELRFITV